MTAFPPLARPWLVPRLLLLLLRLRPLALLPVDLRLPLLPLEPPLLGGAFRDAPEAAEFRDRDDDDDVPRGFASISLSLCEAAPSLNPPKSSVISSSPFSKLII